MHPSHSLRQGEQTILPSLTAAKRDPVIPHRCPTIPHSASLELVSGNTTCCHQQQPNLHSHAERHSPCLCTGPSHNGPCWLPLPIAYLHSHGRDPQSWPHLHSPQTQLAVGRFCPTVRQTIVNSVDALREPFQHMTTDAANHQLRAAPTFFSTKPSISDEVAV